MHEDVMTNRFFPTVFLIAAALFGAASASITPLSARSQAQVAAATPPVETLSPEDQAGRATFQLVCGSCHEAEVATTTLRTRQEWKDLIEMMISFGATASDPQLEQIERYLARRYGRVNINRAPADELELVLDVPSDVARAIVNYRSTLRFTSADDLKAIAGLSAEKVESLRLKIQL
jgi:hypothetical protein